MRAPSWLHHLRHPRGKARGRPRPLLSLSAATWHQLLTELARRGQGRRESGAFLLAKRDPRTTTVSEIVYFDDLDPDCLVGAIHLHQGAFRALWDLCEALSLRVIADVHTHPGSGVGQSSIDREHPMVATSGHVGIIVPNFAQGAVEPRDVGVHVYLGEDGWHSHFGYDAEQRLKVLVL